MHNIPVSEIKEECKEVSLAYAYDANNVYTSAADAINGRDYTCPICGYPMHITTKKSRLRVFARNLVQKHIKAECITIENKGEERSFANLDPVSFILSLCRAVPRKQKLRRENLVAKVLRPNLMSQLTIL